MGKRLSILIVITMVLAMSFTSFAASNTKTSKTSGGIGGIVEVSFTLKCTSVSNASQDTYTLTGKPKSGDSVLLKYYHSQIVTTAKNGSVSVSANEATSDFVISKTWSGAPGWKNTLYSTTTSMKAYNDSAFGSTGVVQLAATY